MLAIYPNFRPHHGRNEGGSPAMFECKLVASKRQTAFGPLCLLGHYLSQEEVLKPLSEVHIAQKSIKHSPQQKLLDALMGILSGCKALYEIDCRLRPDVPLQRAFGRERVADQSTIQRTLTHLPQFVFGVGRFSKMGVFEKEDASWKRMFLTRPSDWITWVSSLEFAARSGLPSYSTGTPNPLVSE